MKTPTLLLVLVSLCYQTFALDNGDNTLVRKCAFSERHEYMYSSNEDYRNSHDHMEASLYVVMSERLSTDVDNSGTNTLNGEEFILPIVFHVIHNNGAENLADSKILDGLNHLNDAFSNSGYYNNSSGLDSQISFCLASIDPNGNSTSGINRIQSNLTDHYMLDEASLKSLIIWDPAKYINVWIVESIEDESIGGYAYLASLASENEDGIVIDYNYVNSNPVLNVPFIHEMGHYLNLYHTFENGCPNDDCLNSGDRICDTPPDNVTYTGSGCMIDNSCFTDNDDASVYNPFTSDMTDLDISFMDYSQFSCMTMFSEHQVLRMKNSIYHYRQELLNSYACEPITPVAMFEINNTETCAGSQVSFYAQPSGFVSDYLWSFPGGSPSTSTLKNPKVVYNNSGSYSVSLTVSNANESDIITLNNLMNVSDEHEYTIFFEDFENGFGANLWTVVNPDFNATWEIMSVASSAYGSSSCYMDNFSGGTTGSIDKLKSKVIDLSEFSNARIELDYAYGSSNLSTKDSLKIYIQESAGTISEIFSLGEESLYYSTSDETYEFFPLESESWCGDTEGCISIDISEFTGLSDIHFVIENIHSGANNLFIDNIKISSDCTLDESSVSETTASISSNVNEICAGDAISFVSEVANATEIFWQFPGGLPALSNEANPVVYYENPGDYPVILQANGTSGSASSNMSITVSELPSITIDNLPASISTSDPIDLDASPLGGFFSGVGVSGSTFNPETAGYGYHLITYTYTDANGCTQSSSQGIFIFTITYTFSSYTSAVISPREHINSDALLTLDNFKAYPNPIEESLHLEWSVMDNSDTDLEIISSDGRSVFKDILSGPPPHKINVEGIPRGMYLLSLRQGEKIKTQSIIKK